MMFAKGEGVEKSTTKADEYFAKACKLGNIADCKSAVKVKPEREQPLSKK